MRIAICGLDMLGTVTAACLVEAKHDVIGWHHSEPFPKCKEKNISESSWMATTNAKQAISDAELIWLTFDTPIKNGVGGYDTVAQWADQVLAEASSGQLVLVSSQLPVGSVRKMADKYPHLKFFCSPENLRNGSAVADFKNPARVIIGTPDYPNEIIASIFVPFSRNLFWCSIESAEFAKHAINVNLAAQIALANELGAIAIRHGANPTAVEHAIRTDERFSPKGYYAYGKGGLGPNLSRDVAYILEMNSSAPTTRGIQTADLIKDI